MSRMSGCSVAFPLLVLFCHGSLVYTAVGRAILFQLNLYLRFCGRPCGSIDGESFPCMATKGRHLDIFTNHY